MPCSLQGLSSPSVNYTQGYSNPNLYKSTDSDGFRGSYGRRGSNRGGFSYCGGINGGTGHNGGVYNKGRGGGKFPNFQCQIYLKYGHTTNICHFHSSMSYQPHESLTFFDQSTLQPIPYTSGSVRTSNT